jgi:DeoR/GlpR family transcriptional regulator of sugar metabolism
MMPEERRRRRAGLVREAGSVTIALLESEFGISPMTARRDLVALEDEGRVRRTHGGAVLPEYAGHEDSFWYRLDGAVEAKERLAEIYYRAKLAGEPVLLTPEQMAELSAKIHDYGQSKPSPPKTE